MAEFLKALLFFALFFGAIIASLACFFWLARREAVQAAVRWLNEHWEWWLAIGAFGCVGFMLHDVTLAKWFYFGGFAFILPPFCALPWVVINLNPMMLLCTGGRVMRFNVYFKLVGWALFVAMVGLLIGAEPTGQTLAEVIRIRQEELVNEPFAMLFLAGFLHGTILFALPVGLFVWTRKERLNPTPHSWDFDPTAMKEGDAKAQGE